MAAIQPSTGYQPGSPRQRAVSAILSAAIIVIAALLAIYQSGAVAKFGEGKSLVAFNVSPAGSSPKAARTVRQQADKANISPPRAHATMPRPRIAIANPQAPTSDDFGIPGFIHLTRAEMAASDIGMANGSKSGTALAEGTGDSAAPGTGDGPGLLYTRNPKSIMEM